MLQALQRGTDVVYWLKPCCRRAQTQTLCLTIRVAYSLQRREPMDDSWEQYSRDGVLEAVALTSRPAIVGLGLGLETQVLGLGLDGHGLGLDTSGLDSISGNTVCITCIVWYCAISQTSGPSSVSSIAESLVHCYHWQTLSTHLHCVTSNVTWRRARSTTSPVTTTVTECECMSCYSNTRVSFIAVAEIAPL